MKVKGELKMPRPRKQESSRKSNSISSYLSDEEFAKCVYLARTYDLDLSSLIRLLINEAFKELKLRQES
jgi:hypothetical protein